MRVRFSLANKFYANICLICAIALSAPAYAAEEVAAGVVTFVLGKAFANDDKALSVGSPIHQGDIIETLGNGHVHIRFIDNGLVSVRPSSKLFIEHYQYNADRPSDSVIKFDLEEGVLRSISGSGAKSARDKFRLNTPIAAIGVRGTDFVVKASSNLIQAVVNEGAIVVAPYSKDCAASTVGPCSGAVELNSTTQKLLELSPLYDTPRLVPLSAAFSPELPAQQSSNSANDEQADLSEQEQATLDSDSENTTDSSATDSSNESTLAVADDLSTIPQDKTTTSPDSPASQEATSTSQDNTSTQAETEENLAVLAGSTGLGLAGESEQERSSYFSDTASQHHGKTLQSLISEGGNEAEIKMIIAEQVADKNFSDSSLLGTPADGRKLAWGRFNAANTAPNNDNTLIYGDITESAQGRLVEPVSFISSRDYKNVAALFRSRSDLTQIDSSLGKVTFDLAASKANLYLSNGATEALNVNGGFLTVDFSQGSFDTGMTLGNQRLSEVIIRAKGQINPETGEFESTFSNGHLKGATTLEGDEASYIIYKDIDAGLVEGATYWRSEP